ncbi:MAG: hypothetical protein IJ498_03055 [Akkermansia sp.]|nr:hypothetical protein [Akkermansia sp.]
MRRLLCSGFVISGLLLSPALDAEPQQAEDDTIVDMGEPMPQETADAPAPAAAEESKSGETAPEPAPFVSPEEEALLREIAANRAAALPGTPPAPVRADQHVVSQSRLFSVSGGDSLRMGAIASRADDVFKRVCSLLTFDTTWKHSISIRLLGQHSDPPRLNPIRMRVRIIGGQPNFQIRIYPGGGIDLQKLDSAVIAMVLYERALRELEADAYPDNIRLPDWLVTGIQQAVLWKNGQVDRDLYRRLFERAEMLPPEEIISIEEPHRLDATTRQVYDVSCGVLVMSLLDSPGGPIQLKALITEGALDEGSPREMITRYFHELGVDESMLDKWWALELAALALPKASEALTPLESEEQLCEALSLVYFDDELGIVCTVSLDNVYRLRELPDWQKSLRPCVERLVGLSATCFPGYRPIVIEYSRVLGDLLSGADPDKLQESLGPLNELRRAYVAAAVRGRDYLDWYEITHLGHTNTRSFDSYLAAMEMLRREDEGAETPMSRYLADIEALHTQKAGESLPSRLREQVKAATTPPEDEPVPPSADAPTEEK